MAKLIQPKINPAYRDFLPPRTEEERKLLRQSIIDDGIRDPIVLTDKGYIVDGHGRWEFAQEFKLKAKTFVKDFADDDAVYEWMAANQAGRRNLTDAQKAYYRGKEYLLAKQPHGGTKDEAMGHSDPLPPRTSETLAAKHSVSEATVRRDAQFAAGVDTLPPKAKSDVLAGKSDLSKKEIAAAVFCPKCARLGPVKGCPQCADLRDKKKAKENEAARKDKKDAPKVGTMKADWAKFEKDFGPVMRFLDTMAAGYGLDKNTGVVEEIRKTLKTFYGQVMDLKKTLTKAES